MVTPALKLTGITGKIAALAVVPALVVGVLTIVLTSLGFDLLKDSSQTLHRQLDVNLKLETALHDVQEHMDNLQDATAAMNRAESLALTLDTTEGISDITEKRAEMRLYAEELSAAVKRFAAYIRELGLNREDDEQNRRIHYLEFASRAAPRYIDFLGESQNETIALMYDGEFRRAEYHFVFEEAGRIAALEQVMDKIARISGEVFEAVVATSSQRRRQQQADTEAYISMLATGTYVALIVGGLLILGCALLFGLRHVTRPILRISEAAGAVETKNFAAPLLSDLRERPDELGQLTRVFLEMTHVVMAREEKLDALVQQRTRELERSNSELTLWGERQQLYLDRLLEAMNRVENGDLSIRLHVTGDDIYARLYRGFNLMTEELSDELRILEVTHTLSGELHLDALLQRVMQATTELLDADRSTLFVYDPKTDELWSRFAEGLESKEIRFRATEGLAGAVFSSGKYENISDPYNDPRFNQEFDRLTGYRTESILCMPITTKNGERIGVTQVLNKRGAGFTPRDEARLRAFSVQIAITLENASLFDEVLTIKNYNENILKSMSNGVITLDVARRVVTANEAALKALRINIEVLIDQPLGELLGDKNAWVTESIAKVEKTGKPEVTVDAEVELPEDRVASINLTVIPLSDVNDTLIGTMLVAEDITSEKRIKSTMARYMSKEVADQLLASGEIELGGKAQRVSVLFSDIRKFTSVSEALGARETVTMLNQYFTEMVDVIFRHGGILDKYIGDAMMALFGAPFNGPQDADNAVATSIDMFKALGVLNERRSHLGYAPIEIGVGVSTGEVVVGNIGSSKRMEYTAIGDSVNLAARLESATKLYGVKILVSEHTVAELKRDIALREIDLIRVKGQDRPVAVYEPLDYHTQTTFPSRVSTLEAYQRGLACYRARDWRRAITCFEQALNTHQQDIPSSIYLKRCLEYSENPPIDDWDGVWTMMEK